MTRPTGRPGARTSDPVDEDGPTDLDEPTDAATPPGRGARRTEGRLDYLYRGNGGIDLIGRKRRWYLVFGALVAISLASILIRGFNFGIDFEGGTVVQFPATGAAGTAGTVQVEQVFDRTLGRPAESVQIAGTGTSATVLIRSERLDQPAVLALRESLFQEFQPLGSSGTPDPASVSDSLVSASWGGEITEQALIALAVFLVLVAAYLTFYFEWRMAVAALIALANDIIITAGVYSLVGFEVSPATVIGLLTILGFSLYDTVVVFDKVRENTRGLLGLTRRTYAEAANLAVNQTLMRSLNTSLIAALPLVGLFVIGVILLGVGVLGDLALVQLVGTVVGAASSVLLATPVLVQMTMRDPKWAAQARKVTARREKRARSAEDAVTDARSAVGTSAGPVTDRLDARAVGAAAGGSVRTADGGVPGPRPGARPAGKSGRPAGKRRR